MQLFARTGNAGNKRQHIFAEPLDDIALGIARSEHRRPASAQAERDDRAAFVVALPPGVGIAAALVGDPSDIAIQGMHERDGVDDCRREPKDLRRDAKEHDGDATAEGSERRIGDEAPLEVTCVVEELELVAMKAVSVAGVEMNDEDERGEGAQ